MKHFIQPLYFLIALLSAVYTFAGDNEIFVSNPKDPAYSIDTPKSGFWKDWDWTDPEILRKESELRRLYAQKKAAEKIAREQEQNESQRKATQATLTLIEQDQNMSVLRTFISIFTFDSCRKITNNKINPT